MFFVVATAGCLAAPYRTHSLSADIKSVKVEIVGQPLFEPVIELGGNEEVLVSFDEMSYESKSFNYSIVHCNADWCPSDLAEMEYIEGFSTGYFDGGVGGECVVSSDHHGARNV